MNSSAADKTSVIVLNWNGWKDTVSCVESLTKLDATGVAIVICDNASTDGSVEHIRSWATDGELDACNTARSAKGLPSYAFVDRSRPQGLGAVAQAAEGAIWDKIVLLQTGRNGGYAAGNNVGIKVAMAAGSDFFWILNNDTEVDAAALFHLRQRMRDDPRIGMCGSTLIYADRRHLVQTYGGARFVPLKGRSLQIGQHARVGDAVDRTAVEDAMYYVNGASIFVRRSLVETVGLMDESYFLYWEEIDWATRSKDRFRLGYAPDSVVYHTVGASIGTNDFGRSSMLSEYFMTRNRIRYCGRYSRISMPFVILDVGRDILRYIATNQRPRAANVLRAAMGWPLIVRPNGP